MKKFKNFTQWANFYHRDAPLFGIVVERRLHWIKDLDEIFNNIITLKKYIAIGVFIWTPSIMLLFLNYFEWWHRGAVILALDWVFLDILTVYVESVNDILEKRLSYYPKFLDSKRFYRIWYKLLPYYPIFWIVRVSIGIYLSKSAWLADLVA